MRLADLMGARVLDSSGQEIGHVGDVRLVERRAPSGSGTAGTVLRVEGLVVATRGRGRLYAYDHRPVDGPLPLTWLARRAARRARWVPWERVAAHQRPERLGEAGTVRLTVRVEDLTPLTRAHDDWAKSL